MFISTKMIIFASEIKLEDKMNANYSNLLHIIIIRLQKAGGSDKVCM